MVERVKGAVGHLGLLKLQVPTLLRKGLRVPHAVGEEYCVHVYVHQVVKVLQPLRTASVHMFRVGTACFPISPALQHEIQLTWQACSTWYIEHATVRVVNATNLQVAGSYGVAGAVRVCESIEESVERPLHELHKWLLRPGCPDSASSCSVTISAITPPPPPPGFRLVQCRYVRHDTVVMQQ